MDAVTTADRPLTTTSTATLSWRSALWALLLIAPAPALGVWAALFAWPGAMGSAIWSGAKLWFLVAPALWWRLVQGQRWQWPRWPSHGVVVGVLSGIAMGAIIIGSYLMLAHGRIDMAPMRQAVATAGLDTPARYLALVVYWTAFNSLVEEYAFRWFLFRQAERLMAGPVAVVLVALIFTAHHSLALAVYVPWHLNLLASLGVLAGGLIWSYCYLRFRSIWPGYLSHIGADIGVFGAGYLALFC